jgi:putative transposase
MPWKTTCVAEQRWRFVRAALQAPSCGFAALCREWQISRRCGYKWLRRAQQAGAAGLQDASRRPRVCPRAFAAPWCERALALHAAHRRVGARKLRALLRRAHPGVRLPAERTLHRWLRAAGLVRPAPPPAGPVRAAPRALAGRRPNDVWTVDFKGWFRTGDSTQVQLLTVRDLASRYVLAAAHVTRPDEASVARCLRRLFRRHGRPRAIRVDRGAPFCGTGPRGWTRLAVGWILHGVAVQFTRRARPQDNGAHEQMHRVLKADTASPPAWTLAAQQRRVERWRRWYNEERPHAALGQQPPAARYRPPPRPWGPPTLPLAYPAGWPALRVDRRGYVCWGGRRRQIGRAFFGHRVGLCVRGADIAVYFGPHLLGTLHADDHLIRPVRLAGGRRCR